MMKSFVVALLLAAICSPATLAGYVAHHAPILTHATAFPTSIASIQQVATNFPHQQVASSVQHVAALPTHVVDNVHHETLLPSHVASVQHDVVLPAQQHFVSTFPVHHKTFQHVAAFPAVKHVAAFPVHHKTFAAFPSHQAVVSHHVSSSFPAHKSFAY